MDEKILMDVGLSKNESKVFLSLIEIGPSTGTHIAGKSKVHRTNVYDALERLLQKGLVSYIMKNNKKYFEATNPNNLMNLLKQKEDNLRNILPQLLLSKKLSKKTEVKVYEGTVAARNTLLSLLEIGEPIYMYGTIKGVKQLFGEHVLNRFQRERTEKKIPQKIIYNHDATERIRELKKLPLIEIKVLPQEFDSPMSTNICGDVIYFRLYNRDPTLTIWIKSKDIADIYKKYFQIMWSIAKKV